MSKFISIFNDFFAIRILILRFFASKSAKRTQKSFLRLFAFSKIQNLFTFPAKIFALFRHLLIFENAHVCLKQNYNAKAAPHALLFNALQTQKAQACKEKSSHACAFLLWLPFLCYLTRRNLPFAIPYPQRQRTY